MICTACQEIVIRSQYHRLCDTPRHDSCITCYVTPCHVTASKQHVQRPVIATPMFALQQWNTCHQTSRNLDPCTLPTAAVTSKFSSITSCCPFSVMPTGIYLRPALTRSQAGHDTVYMPAVHACSACLLALHSCLYIWSAKGQVSPCLSIGPSVSAGAMAKMLRGQHD